MGLIINKFAYPHTPSSYDLTLPYLKFIHTDDPNYTIPIRHYVLNKNLNTLLMAHANSEDIGMFDIEKLSKKFNCNILTFEYSYLGLHSCKTASEENCKKDILYSYNYLLNEGIPQSKIIIYGRSLGTGPATYLASLYPCDLILVSPFKSIVKTTINITGSFDQFRNECIADKVKGKVLILHGCNDKVCDYNQSLELSELFPNLYKFVTVHGAGHHCIYTTNLYYNSIRAFINGDRIY